MARCVCSPITLRRRQPVYCKINIKHLAAVLSKHGTLTARQTESLFVGWSMMERMSRSGNGRTGQFTRRGGGARVIGQEEEGVR